MTGIRSEVLSKHLTSLLAGREVVAGVFTTYSLEPDFFEEEIVTLLGGPALLQDPKIRLVQMEEALCSEIGPLSVYFDPGALGTGSKRLDIRYVPLRVATGRFHPKVILLLTRPANHPDTPAQSLICGVLSANLTRSGWWSSLECCHFEVVNSDDICSFAGDLTGMLKDMRKLGGRDEDHVALDKILSWLRKKTREAGHATIEGRLRPRLVAGTKPLITFLAEVRGKSLSGCRLEVISPFFEGEGQKALKALIDEFELRSARIFLPRDADGAARLPEGVYDAIGGIDGCEWGKLPEALLRLGKSKVGKERGVHAKVYRFTNPKARYEALLVGSHNLTSAAHQKGGNFEASFLVEREDARPAEEWLTPEARRPSHFASELADEENAGTSYLPLELSYNWETKVAEARWLGDAASPRLLLSAGAPVLELVGLVPGEWTRLEEEQAERLAAVLISVSVMAVATPEDDHGIVLVQEYGMAPKPSILLTLSTTSVLEYWSRLSPEQRSSWLAAKGGNSPEGFLSELEAAARLGTVDNFFKSFAGIFHGFEMLRAQIETSLEKRQDRQVDVLLFGQRHNSLPRLLQRVVDNQDAQDAVTRYLILLSARQLLAQLAKNDHKYLANRKRALAKIRKQTEYAATVSKELQLGADGPEFSKWFEKHFLKDYRASGGGASDAATLH